MLFKRDLGKRLSYMRPFFIRATRSVSTSREENKSDMHEENYIECWC